MAHVHGKPLGTRRAALWWLGWHPVGAALTGTVVGLVLGNATAIVFELAFGVPVLGTMALGIVLGFLAGVLVWFRGTSTVNEAYSEVVASVEAGVRAAEVDAMTFVLLGEGVGSRPLVEPHRTYDATVLRLDADALTVDVGTFDLVDRRPVPGGESLGLPYEHVASVEYDGAALVLETTAGDHFEFDTRSEPAELVRVLRDRIRD